MPTQEEVEIDDELEELATQFTLSVTGSAFAAQEDSFSPDPVSIANSTPLPDDRQKDAADKDGLDVFPSQHQAASSATEELPIFKMLATMEAEVCAGTYRSRPAKESQSLVSGPRKAATDILSLPTSARRDHARVVPKCYEPTHGQEMPPPAAAPNVYRSYGGKPIVRGHYGISSNMFSGTPLSARHPSLSSRRTDCLMRPGPIAESEVICRRDKHVPFDYSSIPRMQSGPGGQWELQSPKTGPVRVHEMRMEHSALRGVPLEKRDRGAGFMARWLGSETERISKEVRKPVHHLGAFIHQGGAAHPDFLGAPLVRDGFEIAE